VITVQRRLALISEAFGETAPQVGERALSIVLVITVSLAGQQNVQSVMLVVVPLRVVVARAVCSIAFQIPRLVRVVLQHKMDVTIGRQVTSDTLGQFFQQMAQG
jgi:hypothetical protein